MRRLLFYMLFVPSFGFTQNFTVWPQELTYLTAGDSSKMFEAIKVWQAVMNDNAFLQKLRDTTYVFDLPDDPMKGLSPAQIVDTLLSGKEWYSSGPDQVANIYWAAVKKRLPFSSTVGYGNPRDSTINTYVQFLRNSSLAEIAGHLAHEWSHKIGFDHQEKNHPARDQTVPYVFGNLVSRYGTGYQKVVE